MKSQEFIIKCRNQFIQEYSGKDIFLFPTTENQTIRTHPKTNTGFKSKKQDIIYNLAIYEDELLIYCEIKHPVRLKSMQHDFWIKFSELGKLGNFIFFSHGSNPNIQSKKNKKQSKSAIYDLIKEIVLMEE